jgi:hypothetical protein
MDAVDALRIDDRERIGRHIVDRQPPVADDARPDPPVVERDQREPLPQAFDLRRPPVADNPHALDEQDRRSRAGPRIEERRSRSIKRWHDQSAFGVPPII